MRVVYARHVTVDSRGQFTEAHKSESTTAKTRSDCGSAERGGDIAGEENRLEQGSGF
jgi:hypothetical protein